MKPHSLILLLAALLPVMVAADPLVLYYLDNPSHLVEVDALAREILPVDRWFTGWSEGTNFGHAVNQVNAPLVWALCGLLVMGGLPIAGVYQAGILLSNLIFTFGLWKAASRWLGPERALPGVILAASWANDLFGFAGAVGGMWPHRLANGLLLWGLGSRRRDAPSIAIWLGVLLLCHTYSGMAAALLVVIAAADAAWRGQRERLLSLVGGAFLGALWTMPFWLPLLDEGLRPVRGRGSFPVWLPQDYLALMLLPFHSVTRGDPRDYWYVAAPGSFLGSLVLGVGLWRLRREWTGLKKELEEGRLVLWGAAVLVVLTTLVVQLTQTELFGPNPWRHLSLPRNLLHLGAGVGIAALIARFSPAVRPVFTVGLALMVGAGTGLSGHLDVPLSELRAIRAELSQTWEDLGAEGRVVYHQNPNLNPDAPQSLFFSQVGGIFSLEQQQPVVGSWYSVTPIATNAPTRSEGKFLAGRPVQDWDPPAFRERLAELGIGAVVAVDPELADLLSRTEGLEKVTEHGPFSGWRVEGAPPKIYRSPVPDLIGAQQVERGSMDLEVQSEKAARLVLFRSYHPWWTATWEGEGGAQKTLEIRKEKGTGFLEMNVPGKGRLLLRYEDPTRWTRWLGLLGLSVTAALALWGARRRIPYSSSPPSSSPSI